MGLTPLETKHPGSCRPEEDVRSESPSKSLTGLIGYTCSYTPVELLSATGYRPYHLLHGNIALSTAGEEYVRIDACPLVKSNIRYVLQNRKDFVAIVGSTGCDMARRMLEVITYETKLPTFLFNNPRTDNRRMFNDEIDWLVDELEKFSGKRFTADALVHEIHRWEGARQYFRELDEKRRAVPSMISTAQLHSLAASYHKGDINGAPDVREDSSASPRVYLLGSSMPYEASPILSMIEEQLRIVGDFNCGISRFTGLKIGEPDLDGIKKAYYDQPPCIFKRPNAGFYKWIESEIKGLDCVGAIAWTLDYCDSFEFELNRIERTIGRPMLRLKSDFSIQNMGQLRTRVGAFAEMLRRQ